MLRSLLITLTLCLLGSFSLAEAVELKIATVAPRGSMWMRYLNKMKAKIAKETNGEVKIRYYPGQVQGDERDVVRKMRTGQLDGGAFTATGLSLVNPTVLVLQMPTMFKNAKQLDKVRNKMRPIFEKSFVDRGYVMLGWAEVGPIHIFSNAPVRNVNDLKKQKVWAWSDEPITKAMMRTAKVTPRLLGLPQVLPALNTGIINTVYNSPLALLALQWHAKVKYVLAEPFAIGIGATVLSKRAFEKIDAKHRALVLKITQKYHQAIIKRTRKDNKRAMAALVSQFKIKSVKISPEGRKQFDAAAAKTMRSFAPRYYSKKILDQVLAAR